MPEPPSGQEPGRLRDAGGPDPPPALEGPPRGRAGLGGGGRAGPARGSSSAEACRGTRRRPPSSAVSGGRGHRRGVGSPRKAPPRWGAPRPPTPGSGERRQRHGRPRGRAPPWRRRMLEADPRGGRFTLTADERYLCGPLPGVPPWGDPGARGLLLRRPLDPRKPPTARGSCWRWTSIMLRRRQATTPSPARPS